MITLALDASTYIGSVAILAGGEVIAECEAAMRGEHEERLMPAVAATLEAASVSLEDVDRIVCGAGPGSFTSLRIAGAIAKGMAVGARLPLFAVPSLALLVASQDRKAGEWVAAMDAMRGEWYVASYLVEAGVQGMRVVEAEPARVVSEAELCRTAIAHGGRLVGGTLSIGVGSEESMIAPSPMDRPHARGAGTVDPSLIVGPVDLAAWEPVYGRLAEAQVKWEAAHGRPLGAA